MSSRKSDLMRVDREIRNDLERIRIERRRRFPEEPEPTTQELFRMIRNTSVYPKVCEEMVKLPRNLKR